MIVKSKKMIKYTCDNCGHTQYNDTPNWTHVKWKDGFVFSFCLACSADLFIEAFFEKVAAYKWYKVIKDTLDLTNAFRTPIFEQYTVIDLQKPEAFIQKHFKTAVTSHNFKRRIK